MIGQQTTRALGVTSAVGYWVPLLQAAALGAIFVGISLAGYHAPTPREARIDAVGTPSAISDAQATLDHVSPGGYQLTAVATPSEGTDEVTSGRAFGFVTFGSTTTLTYAGANGPTVTTALLRDFGSLAGATTSTLVPHDARPLGPNDSAGLPIFYLVFGVVLASYLFAVTSVNVGATLPARGHWTGAAVLAAILGVVATLMARFGTHTITSGAVVVALLLFLTSLGVSAGSWLCLRSSRLYGSLVASVVMIVLGSASGGLVPGAWLPAWLAVFRPVLPMGAGLSGIRDQVYFDGHLLALELAVLLAWAVIPIVIGQLLERRSSARATTAPPADHVG